MPNKYPNTSRNRYAKDELSALSRRGEEDYPEWLEKGGEDGREAERRRLMEDVHGKDAVGMVDVVADIGTVTPVGMAVNSLAEAGEEIRKDPTKVRSYLNAVKKFGESGAVDPSHAPNVSMGMARTWIDPKGKKYDLDHPVVSHEEWLESNYGGPRRNALREGYIRESNDIIQVDNPSNPQLSLPLRRAAQYGPVNVQVKNKDYLFTPQELSDAYFDLPTAIANQRKYKSKSSASEKD